MSNTETREINLNIRSQRLCVEKLLHECDLRMDDTDRYFGIFGDDDTLIGGAGIKGNVIKCVAIAKNARDLALANKLISRIRSEAREAGKGNLFLFTKPENEFIFQSLAFHTVGKAENAILMESDKRGIEKYCSYLEQLRRPGYNGVIIMNCNPLTNGHKYLIDQASKQVDNLYIIPVYEDVSHYSYSERMSMIKTAVSGYENIIVCEGSKYAISAATFPSYFLKRIEDGTLASMKLDLDIFTRHIAPALNISVRFAGTEPQDNLTSSYNATMNICLSAQGIKFIEIPRLMAGDIPVSASRVREFLSKHEVCQALKLLPSSSLPVVLAHEATTCLLDELNCTPKPGLVDTHDNGAHTDMDVQLMERSISAIRPFLAKAAAMCDSNIADLIQLGKTAEQAMLETTGGINTHKGAIFAMMLTLVAFMRRYKSSQNITAHDLSHEISALAAGIPQAMNTHGCAVRKRHNIPGALDNAREGYNLLVTSWLPFYRSHESDPHRLHLTLLKIMTELHDSNVWHRAGTAGAAFVKESANAILDNFSVSDLEKFNTACINRNISPGGAADMLALTILFDKLTSN